MGIKKKLGLGMASAALGLSLVGGGTFAYFNDVDTLNNKFANGVLDLKITPHEDLPINFDLSNLKPGDSIQRMFKLDADGTLAIQKVYMALTANADDFKDGHSAALNGNVPAMREFLSQFRVTMFKGQIATDPITTGSDFQPEANILNSNSTVLTLLDLLDSNLNGKISSNFYDNGKINLTPTGVPVDPDDQDGVQMTITFHDDGSNQNKFQGDAAKFQFVLTGTQYSGTTVKQGASNGYLETNEHIQVPGEGAAVGSQTIIYSNSTGNITNDGSNPYPVLGEVVTPGTDVPNDN
jgi:spore coat-associated protein N